MAGQTFVDNQRWMKIPVLRLGQVTGSHQLAGFWVKEGKEEKALMAPGDTATFPFCLLKVLQRKQNPEGFKKKRKQRQNGKGGRKREGRRDGEGGRGLGKEEGPEEANVHYIVLKKERYVTLNNYFI